MKDTWTQKLMALCIALLCMLCAYGLGIERGKLAAYEEVLEIIDTPMFLATGEILTKSYAESLKEAPIIEPSIANNP